MWFPSVLETLINVHSIGLIGLIISVLKFESKSKNRTFSILRFKSNFPTKLRDNLLDDDQSKTTSILIESLIVFNLSVELKHLIIVFFFDTQASVLD